MKFYTFIFYSLGLVSLSLSQTEICSDDDTVISIGLSIWTDVSTCSEAYTYLQTQNLNCFSDLNLPFVSAEPITFAEICCETCQDQIVYGCTDEAAFNYNSEANTDDGSCISVIYGCTDDTMFNYDSSANTDDGSCIPIIYGCTDPIACNYDQDATIEDGSCQYAECCDCLGCTDINACNYNSDASEDDGSCSYAEEWFNCDGTCIDLDNDGICDLEDDCIADNNNICGCTDLEACNFNQNATDDDGSCDYGLECLLSPCSSSEDPGIDGAYCIDDYCNGCCAIWYNSDGTIISNSCDENSNSMIGLWYDFDADQYIEITENEIVFYTYLDDPNFNCWYYWSMDYTNLGISPITGLEMIEFIDEEDGPIQLSINVLDNGNLQLGDDAGDGIQLSPIDELPELEMCFQNSTSEGCEDFFGQWTYLNYAYIIIDEEGAKFMIPNEDSDVVCYDSINLSYSQLNDSETCQLFLGGNGIAFEFAQISLNDDGTLFLESNIVDFPNLWDPDNTDLTSLEDCIYGCTEMLACNFDPLANSDNGTCGVIDDCGDCRIPYCLYDGEYIDYVEADNCEGVWIGNNCENNDYCLSGSEDILWNSGCSIGLDEIKSNLKIISNLNMLGQTIHNNNSGFRFIIYNNGLVEKKYLLNNE